MDFLRISQWDRGLYLTGFLALCLAQLYEGCVYEWADTRAERQPNSFSLGERRCPPSNPLPFGSTLRPQ